MNLTEAINQQAQARQHRLAEVRASVLGNFRICDYSFIVPKLDLLLYKMVECEIPQPLIIGIGEL